MISTTSTHIPKEELLAFVASGRPAHPQNGRVALHLWTGCEQCASWLAGYAQARQDLTPQAPSRARPTAPRSWIRPRRFRVRQNLRAGNLADVSLLCGAGPYELDVLVREIPAPPSLAIAGQITRAEHIHEPVPELPLSLLAPATCEVVMATQTNEFGEFTFDITEEGEFGLRCGTAADAPVVLLWDGSV